MDPAILTLALAATAAAAGLIAGRRIARRGRRRGGPPAPSSVYARNPEAIVSPEGDGVVVSLPGQPEGLVLNAVAARCWELIDGERDLRTIARILAAEQEVSVAGASREVAGLAARLEKAWCAQPDHRWAMAHTHFHDVFSGARDEGITEIPLHGEMIIHVASEALEDGDPPRFLTPLPWWKRRRAARACARHMAREEPLRGALAAFRTGWDHSAAGRLPSAAAAFREAVRLAPGWANPHYQLGYVALRGRRYDAARRAFAEAERLKPGFFMVREYLALTRLIADGCVSVEAFHLFERAAQLEPAEPDRAIECLRRALAISPGFPTARMLLGRAYARRGEYAKALEELRMAVDGDPDASTLCNALYTRGSIFLRRGMPEQANREFHKVIEIDGSVTATRSALVRLASEENAH